MGKAVQCFCCKPNMSEPKTLHWKCPENSIVGIPKLFRIRLHLLSDFSHLWQAWGTVALTSNIKPQLDYIGYGRTAYASLPPKLVQILRSIQPSFFLFPFARGKGLEIQIYEDWETQRNWPYRLLTAKLTNGPMNIWSIIMVQPPGQRMDPGVAISPSIYMLSPIIRLEAAAAAMPCNAVQYNANCWNCKGP